MRELPYELRECIAQSLLNKLSVDRHLDHGPLLLHVILGPGSLEADGDAWRLVASWLRFPHKRSALWPTWHAVVDELRRERGGVADMEDDDWWMSLETCVRNDWPLLLSTFLDCVIEDPLMKVDGPPSRKAFANSTNADGFSLFDLACMCGWANANVVKVLIDAGASLARRDAYGRTVLHRVVFCTRPVVVQCLLASGAEVDAVDNDGQTPLHCAVDIVRRPDDPIGNTPPFSNGTECVRLLVHAGANVHLRDRLGRTPLDMLTVSDDECNLQERARDACDVPWGNPRYLIALQDSIAVLRQAEQTPAA